MTDKEVTNKDKSMHKITVDAQTLRQAIKAAARFASKNTISGGELNYIFFCYENDTLTMQACEGRYGVRTKIPATIFCKSGDMTCAEFALRRKSALCILAILKNFKETVYLTVSNTSVTFTIGEDITFLRNTSVKKHDMQIMFNKANSYGKKACNGFALNPKDLLKVSKSFKNIRHAEVYFSDEDTSDVVLFRGNLHDKHEIEIEILVMPMKLA